MNKQDFDRSSLPTGIVVVDAEPVPQQYPPQQYAQQVPQLVAPAVLPPNNSPYNAANPAIPGRPQAKQSRWIGVAVLVVVVVVGFSFISSFSSGNRDCPVVLNEEVRTGENYIGLIFPACPSEEAFEAFVGAANRWSAIIDATDRPVAQSSQDLSPANICGFQSQAVFVNAGDVVDHLVIVAETIDIDGPGGTLAQAGQCFNTGGQALIGGMQFDNADIEELEDDGSLEDVILHEMGHVLGIGTLWGNLLQDRTFNGDQINLNAQPRFVGNEATNEFETLTGQAQDSVPVEDGRRDDGSFFFDVAQGEGRGSIDGHFKITVFDNELMVFAIDPNVEHPLSRVSIASLEDIGFDVDLTLADDFALSRSGGRKKKLRGEHKVHELKGDILNIIRTPEDIANQKFFKTP